MGYVAILANPHPKSITRKSEIFGEGFTNDSRENEGPSSGDSRYLLQRVNQDAKTLCMIIRSSGNQFLCKTSSAH